LGNDWRVQMVKTAEAAVTVAPLKGHVILKIANSDNTVPDQIALLNSIIELKPAAIIVDPASLTGLNPTLQRACAAGIVVVSFDTADTAPCSYQVGINFVKAAELGASWMIKTLHGKGTLFEDTGLAGYATAQSIFNGWAAIKSYPNLHVVGTYQGEFAVGPEEAGVSSLLAAHPTVNGILTQGYCTGAMQALKDHGLKQVPMYCQAYNGTLEACLSNKTPCIATSDPPYLSADALEIAVNILNGKKPAAKNVMVGSECFIDNGIQPAGATCHTMKLGTNTFSNIAPGLTLPVSPPWTNIKSGQV